MGKYRLGRRGEGLEVGEDGTGVVFEAFGPIGLLVLVSAAWYRSGD